MCPAILLIGIYPREMEVSVCTVSINVHNSFICSSPKLELTRCPSTDESDEQIVVYP